MCLGLSKGFGVFPFLRKLGFRVLVFWPFFFFRFDYIQGSISYDQIRVLSNYGAKRKKEEEDKLQKKQNTIG